MLWLANGYVPPLDGISCFKLNVSDVAAATEPEVTSPVLPGKLNAKSGCCAVKGGNARGEFCAFFQPQKTTSGTGKNKLLTLYLAFAASLTTRYRKIISG